MSEVIRVCFGFALVLCDWLEKNNVLLPSRVFPRLAPLHVFVSSSDWFNVLFASVVIGQSDNLGFGFTCLVFTREVHCSYR